MRLSIECQNEMQKLSPYKSMAYISHRDSEKHIRKNSLLPRTSAPLVNKAGAATRTG
jgi:hypothetical protein